MLKKAKNIERFVKRDGLFLVYLYSREPTKQREMFQNSLAIKAVDEKACRIFL